LLFRIELRTPAINNNASVRVAFTDFAEECHIGCAFSKIHV